MTTTEREDLIAAVRVGRLTPEQRDELAVMAGIPIAQPDEIYNYTRYFFRDRVRSHLTWHPESSREDCHPLLAEVERRGLWQVFESFAKPADIVVAFIKTMEAVK